MTRAPTKFAVSTGSMASAPNPYGQQTPATGTKLDNYAFGGKPPASISATQSVHVGSGVTNISANTTAASQQQQQQQLMSEHLAHSSSLLVGNSDSYIAGMSSDSELTSANSRHHHYHHGRPYSSQSRIYHAHPVPRNTHSSSRVSYYSDSAATGAPAAYVSAEGAARSEQAANISGLGSNVSAQQAATSARHLPHQGSVSSTGSNSSVAAYLGSLAGAGAGAGIGVAASESPVSQLSSSLHMQQQQQQQQQSMAAMQARPQNISGRQLPQRPFKQSMSIDQQPNQQLYHHQTLLGHVSSPAHSLSPHFEPLPPPPEVGPSSGHYSSARYNPATSSPRNFRNFSELDMIEKQAANISLYDSQSNAGGLPPEAGRPSSSASVRKLPPTLASGAGGLLGGPKGAMSLDHLHHQRHQSHTIEPPHPHSHSHSHKQQSQASYLSSHEPGYETQQQQQHLRRPQHQQHHYQADLYHTTSSPGDWLPPLAGGPQHQQQHSQHGGLNKTTGHQFRQTMSIDHYQLAQQQQQQQQHYSPVRLAPHYPSLDSYAGAGFEPTAHQLAAYSSQTTTGDSHNNEVMFQHQPNYAQDHLGQQQHHQTRQHNQDSINPSSSFVASQQQQQLQFVTPKGKKLQHQVSSSSSNSQSGSLKSANLENLTSSGNNTNNTGKAQLSERTNALTHFQASYSPQHQHQPLQHHHHHQQQQQQQQHHNRYGLLKKGLTSALSGFGGSSTTLNESERDLSSSTQATTTLSSHSGPAGHPSSSQLHGAIGKLSALRATSPSGAYEIASGPSSSLGLHNPIAGGQRHHQDGHQQQQQQQQQLHHHHHQHHHHSSSSKEGTGTRSESSTGLPNGPSGHTNSSLTKKSNSTTQLSMTGTKKRLGFRKKQVTSFSVHRSEEVAPLEARHLVKQASSVSEGDSSMSGDSSSRSWSNSNFKQQTPDELASMSFIDGLGKGQMISRQGLASPYLGDIQLSLCDRRGNLEVEIIRARNLQAKANKVLPLTYVKLYLVKNRKCLAKAKTTLSNKRTLDPLFQQQLTFHEDYHGCILQSIIWGNFGKIDKKNFMGIAQISLDDLELSDTVISWYKLFLPSSLQTLPSKSLRHTLLSNSTESFTNTNNS